MFEPLRLSSVILSRMLFRGGIYFPLLSHFTLGLGGVKSVM